MSGHSHFATIKRQKESKDAARGNLFGKLSKMIQIAIKSGGGSNPDNNFKLRVAIDKARSFNLPKDNIDRILKAAEEKLTNIEEVTYEGFGPHGVLVIVETATDNRNRTGQEIKNIFEKAGGSVGGPNSVAFNFDNRGVIKVKKSARPDEQMLSLIDLGVLDVEDLDTELSVVVEPEKLSQVNDEVIKLGYEIVKTELAMLPKNYVEISGQDKIDKLVKFIDSLEDHDDVQRVYTNF